MVKNLVVGAGFAGACIAYLLAEKSNEKVTIIDKKNHVAGNCYDYRDEHGIMIHKYGSHIFHTNSEKVWNFITQFTKFNSYEHKVIAHTDSGSTCIPFNLNSLHKFFSESDAIKFETKLISKYGLNSKVPILEFQNEADIDLKYLADFIYEKIFLHYTKKQWGVSPDKLDRSVTARIPIFIGYNDNFFQDKHQGIPIEGYTRTVEKMLCHKNIQIQLNTDFSEIDVSEYNRIFYTGPIDEFYNYEYGELPYRSLRFELETIDKPYYQSYACENYTYNQDFTRIHEYKYYLEDKSAKTVIAKEYPEAFKLGINERYYPIPQYENYNLYNKYLELAKDNKNVFFLGRLGNYKYLNIDTTILNAIELFEIIT